MSLDLLKKLAPELCQKYESSLPEVAELMALDFRERFPPSLLALPQELAPYVAVARCLMATTPAQEELSPLYQHYGNPLLEAMIQGILLTYWGGYHFASFLLTAAEELHQQKKPFPRELASAAIEIMASRSSYHTSIGVKILNAMGSEARPAVEKAAFSHSSITMRRELARFANEKGWKLAQEKPLNLDPEREAILRRLVLAWGRCRDPELAKAIRSAAVALPAAPVFERVSDREVWWLEQARSRDSAIVTRLLSCPWPKQWKDGLERVRKLKEFPPDPRIAQALTELLHRQIYNSWGSNPLIKEAAALIRSLADPECLPLLTEVHQEQSARWRNHPTVYPQNQLEQVMARGKVLPKTQEEEALLIEASPMLGANNREELLTAVYQNPTEDSPRLVYADFLTEAGDPYGEFIQLQLQPNPTKAATRRINALLSQYGERWVEGLPGAQRNSIVFERGFPSFCQVELSKDYVAQFSHRSWATLNGVYFTWACPLEALEKLLPLLPSLQGAHNLFPGQLQHFESSQLTALSISSLPPSLKLPAIEWFSCTQEFALDFLKNHSPKTLVLYADPQRGHLQKLLTSKPAIETLVLFLHGSPHQPEGWVAELGFKAGLITGVSLSFRPCRSHSTGHPLSQHLKTLLPPGTPIRLTGTGAPALSLDQLKAGLRWASPDQLHSA